jgi:hypothetical protein
MIANILLVFAFVFAVIAALFASEINRPPLTIHFGWLSIAFYFLSILLGALK